MEIRLDKYRNPVAQCHLFDIMRLKYWNKNSKISVWITKNKVLVAKVDYDIKNIENKLWLAFLNIKYCKNIDSWSWKKFKAFQIEISCLIHDAIHIFLDILFHDLCY